MIPSLDTCYAIRIRTFVRWRRKGNVGVLLVLVGTVCLAGCGGGGRDETLDLETGGIASQATDSLGRKLGAISARVVEANRAADESLNLLARLEVSADELLEFYEPTLGIIIVSAAGAPLNPTIAADRFVHTPVEEIWAWASGGAPIPAPLFDAIARARNRESIDGNGAPERKANDEVQSSGGGSQQRPTAEGATQALSGGWCDTDYFSSGYGSCQSFDYNVCLDNWWNGAFAKTSDNWYVYTNVCAAEGSAVTLKFASENGGGVWSVPLDSMRLVIMDDSDCGTPWDWNCPDARSDIQNAAGDRFHFRYNAFK